VPASTPYDALPIGLEVVRVRTLLEALQASILEEPAAITTGTMRVWSTVAASR
jgi:hypothetical protein